MSEVDGESHINGIPTVSEFNDHKAKQALNCDDNEVGRDGLNNEGIHDQSIEKPKSGADPLNPIVSINDSVDKGENQINSGSIPKIEITEGSSEDNSELNTDDFYDGKVINSYEKEQTSVSLNKTDDELASELCNGDVASPAVDTIQGNNFNSDNDKDLKSVEKDQRSGTPEEDIQEKAVQETASKTGNNTQVSEDNLENNNSSSEILLNKEQKSETLEKDIQDKESESQETTSNTGNSTQVSEGNLGNNNSRENKEQTSETFEENYQDKEEKDTTRNTGHNTQVSEDKFENNQNQSAPSNVKHVTFEDTENYDYLILNHQTDEDKELNQENEIDTQTGDKQNKSFEEDTEQNSHTETSQSWPSYRPETEDLDNDKPKQDSTEAEEKDLSSRSDASESWPSYQPESEQEKSDKKETNEKQSSEKDPPSETETDNTLVESKTAVEPSNEELKGNEDSESWPSYQPESENKEDTEKSASNTQKGQITEVNSDPRNAKVENFDPQDSVTVENQVAPAATAELPADKADKSDVLDDSFPSYEPEVAPVNICDDTLDDIEPISTITDNQIEESNDKPVENMENEPTEKSDTTKSEVADDKAIADDAPKRDANDDTDLETTEDLKSEEVMENKEAEDSNAQNEQDNTENHTEEVENTNAPPSSPTEDKTEEPERVASPQVETNEKEKDQSEEKKDEQKEKAIESESSKPPEQKDNKEEEPKKEEELPEPVPIPVVRNVDVDKAVLTLSDLESTVNHLMTEIKNLMGDYHARLSAQPLSDFVLDLGKFRGDFVSVSEAYKKCENLSVLLNKCLKELRYATDDVNILISKKFREEDLATWVDDEDKMEEDKDKLREERIAVERSALAKASDARAAIANATTGVAESKLFASEAEVEAAETAALAKRAWEIAETARRTAEEAKKAAEEKRQAEEEARKRAQERARIRAEEERKKREEENVVLREEAKKKGTTFEDERKRADEEQARKEAERKNPKNWPRSIYSIEPGDFDPGIGCIIRSIDGCLKRDDVEVRRLDQMSGILTLIENEELVSNIIEIVPTDPEKKFSFEEPLAIGIPHCFTRGTQGREAVVKTLQSNGKWIEVPTSDVYFEDIKELRFVEMRTRKFGVFAVVARLKREHLVFSRKGNKVMSSADPRITLTCRPGMFKINVNFHIEVQTVDSTTLSEVKHRKPEECANVITTSPILRFHIANRKFSKPVMITMPLPASSSKPKRPTTAGINREKDDQNSESRIQPARPTTAFVSSTREDDADEEIHLLVKGNVGTWTKLQNIALIQSKNKDIVTFDIPDPYEKFLLLRMKKGATVPIIEKIPSLLELSLNHRSIQFFLRQQNTALNNIRLSCSNSGRTEKSLRNLAEEGYEEGPKPSKDIIVKEGQILHVRFRGNLKCLTDIADLKFVFNTHIKGGLEFNVIELDKFAQKSFHCYRGFVKIFTMVKVSKQVPPPDTSSSSQQKPVYEVVEEEVLLAELLINLPKPDPEPPQPLATAPIRITDEGPVNDDILEFVATELGDEWKRLAQFLNLKRMRIQAILRQNNSNPDPKRIRLDMLMSWAKRLPRCVNKVEILAHALESIGRADISEVLRDRDAEFRRQRADSARDSFLRRAFIKVAQNPNAVKDWKAIAKRLGVPEGDLVEIDKTKPSIQEKCFHSLKKWQTVAGDSATLPTLSAKLKVFKHRQLAREIETIG